MPPYLGFASEEVGVEHDPVSCLVFLAVLVSQVSLLPAIGMRVRLCSDSDYSLFYCTSYGLILGNQKQYGALSLLHGPKLSHASNATENTSLASCWALKEAQIHPSCVLSPRAAKISP